MSKCVFLLICTLTGIYTSNSIIVFDPGQDFYDTYYENVTTNPYTDINYFENHELPTPSLHLARYWRNEFIWMLDKYSGWAKRIILDTAEIKWAFLRDVITGDIDLGVALDALMSGKLDGEAQPVVDFAKDQVSILATFAICLIAAALLPLIGCCFGCCRCCCKRCGGRLSVEQAQKQSSGCCACVSIHLFVVVAVLGFGGLACTMVGHRFLRASDIMWDSADLALLDGREFTEVTMAQLDHVVLDDFETAMHLMNSRLDDAGVIVSRPMMAAMLEDMRQILRGLDHTEEVITGIDNSISRANVYASQLGNESAELTSQLDRIRSNISDMRTSCASNGFSSATCDDLPPGSLIPPAYDFSQTPDLNSQVVLSDDIEGLGLDTVKREARAEYEDIPNKVNASIVGAVDDTRDVINAIEVGEVEAMINDMRTPMYDLEATLARLQNDVSRYRRDADPYIQNWDIWVMIVGCIILVAAVFALLGCCCGVLGRRIDSAPENRSKLSHGGGGCLMCSVCVGFIIVPVLLVMGALLLLVFGNITLMCSTFDRETIFEEVIDNGELWGESPIGSVVSFPDMEVPTVQGLLESCEDGATLYTAFGLETLLNVSSVVNLDEIRGDIDLSALSNQSADGLVGVTIVDPGTRSDIETVFAGWPQPIVASEATENLYTAIHNLNMTSLAIALLEAASLSEIVGTDYEILYTALASQLVGMNMLNARRIESLVSALTRTIGELQDIIDDGNSTVTGIIRNAASMQDIMDTNGTQLLEQGALELVDSIMMLAEDYLENVEDMLTFRVGQCDLMWDVYHATTQCICHVLLDTMNASWLTFLWMALMIVISIIIATRLSKYFRIPNDSKEFITANPVHMALVRRQSSIARHSLLGINVGRSPPELQGRGTMQPTINELQATILANQQMALAGQQLLAPSSVQQSRSQQRQKVVKDKRRS